jgi:class 3 adenylate cyclase
VGLPASPTGTVTFLFTDIEGSTQRWERFPEAMREAIRRHDALLRAAIEAHGGYVFKTVGDAFCAAFAAPADAVRAAFDVQRELQAADFSAVDGIRVRAAIHAGSADERDGDYFGPVVNRVARLLAIGHGGQVLLSQLAADLLADAMPESLGVRDLGYHSLKSLSRPEHVFQLTAADLPDDFPELTSQHFRRSNLPSPASSLIGRDNDVARVRELLATERLVTLTGPGGVGKTRLALCAASEAAAQFGDGTWFVDLAVVQEDAFVAGAFAAALNVPQSADRPVLESLKAVLGTFDALLVVDNCEHLLEEVARVVGALLESCPSIRILATSRESLRVNGEHTLVVAPLALPLDD